MDFIHRPKSKILKMLNFLIFWILILEIFSINIKIFEYC
jgi:hypothetical protein